MTRKRHVPRRFCLQNILSGGHDQLAVFHTFGGDQKVRHLLHLRGRTLHDDHFQAIVVIEMDVEGGKDFVVKLVLQIGQLLTE